MARRQQQRRPAADPFLTQAQQLAILRFGPELSGLNALRSQAAADYKSMVANAKGSRKAVEAGIADAAPKVSAAYDAATDRIGQVNTIVDADLAKIGPVTGQSAALQQAIQLERQRAANSIATLKGSATADFEQQGLDAVKAERAAVKAARQQRSEAFGQIAQRAVDLGREQGAFVTSTAQQLGGEAAAAQAAAEQRAAELANARLIARINARTSRQNAEMQAETSRQNAQTQADATLGAAQISADARRDTAGGGRGGRSGLRTRDAHRSFQDEVSRLQRTVAGVRRRRPNTSRQALGQLLLDGVPAGREPVLNQKGERVVDADGVLRTREVPAINPATKNALATTVALDLALNGKVSRGTLDKLHKAGFSIRELGLPYTSVEESRRAAAVRGAVSDATSAVSRGASGTLDWLLRALGG